MELIFRDLAEKSGEILFFPVLENEKKIVALIAKLGYEDEKVILRRLKKQGFNGQSAQKFVIHDDNQTVVLLGSGKQNKLSSENWRQLSGEIINYLKDYRAQKIALDLSYWLKGSNDYERLGQSIAEGLVLANYSFDHYKKSDHNKNKVEIKQVFVDLAGKEKNKFAQGFHNGLLMSEGVIRGRNLVNEPAGRMTPAFLAEVAQEIARTDKNISVRIYDEERIAKMKMGAFLGIARGSSNKPKFIHLIYRSKGKAKEKIALVGKGVTFDSGGLNIKPWEGMGQMKIDMSGAACVLGIFQVLAKLNVKAEVHGIIAACENMPSGSAVKPGDVLANLEGKTIEIAHTDAEGRVTMADSLAYAKRQKPDKIIDIATLTASIIMALGPQYAGLFTLDDKLSRDIVKYSQLSGENFWPMPMAVEYKDFNKSQIADIRNIGAIRPAGSISAAWFLQYFVGDNTAWAHLDIAGTAYAEKPFNSYTPVGGVGFGIRTLLEWLRSL